MLTSCSVRFLITVALCAVGTHALYSSGSDVVSLTTSNFDRLVKGSNEIWIVEFYAPWCGHCKQFVSEYSKAATALKGVVKVGGVNADDDKSLAGQYKVGGFPTVKIIYGSKVEDYNGPRTARGLVDAALKAVKDKVESGLSGKSSSGSGGSGSSKDVVELTDSNFQKKVLDSDDPWLVEFYAPWCGHCQKLAPEWAKAASELKGKVKLGAIDATVNTALASDYDVKGYPTIKFFPGGKKSRSSAEEFDGGRTANDIVSWATDKAAESAPPPELLQILGETELSKGCNDHSLCVVSVLPHILDCDAKCRNAYLNVLKKAGERFKKHGWGWVWAQAADHLKLEEALDIGGFGYPAMAIVNVKKGKYSLFRGSFSEDGVGEFLRDLSYGRGSTAPLKGAALPKLSKVEPWDGKDGQPPVEEDISFDDDKDEL